MLALTMNMSCGRKSNTENESPFVPGDELKFNSTAYDSMRRYYSSDTAFILMLTEKINAGDTNAIMVKNLLVTPYESRNATGLNDSKIGTLILGYRVSKRTLDKFSEIENSLPQEDAASIRETTDSVVNSIEEMKRDLQNN